MEKHEIGYRVFVGERPIEELSAGELKEFCDRTVKRMGEALNDHFTQHPEEFKRI